MRETINIAIPPFRQNKGENYKKKEKKEKKTYTKKQICSNSQNRNLTKKKTENRNFANIFWLKNIKKQKNKNKIKIKKRFLFLQKN